MDKITTFLIVLALAGACSVPKEQELPERAKILENLTRYPADAGPEKQINIEREISFGSTEEVLIGPVGGMAADKEGRVFIGDNEKHTIHVFDAEGNYLTNLGREGAGPGEFRIVGYLATQAEWLFAHDFLQLRLNAFSLDSFESVYTLNLNAIQTSDIEALKGWYNPGAFYFLSRNRYLVGFSSVVYRNPSNPRYNLNDRFELFYFINGNGEIISDQIFKLKEYRALTARVKGEFRSTQFKFLGESLLAVSNTQEIYTARTKDFLIEVRDSNGVYKRSFYHPVAKQRFTREEVIRIQKEKYNKTVFDYRESVINNASEEQIPNWWPVLAEMMIDDEDRLWVSVVTDSKKTYDWWVMNEYGKLMARFSWPRDKEIEKIKNGKLYTREKNTRGITRIVRYDITMNK